MGPMTGAGDTECPLKGGNTTPVVRVGSTVRRQAGPWTPTIHALLRHVRRNGFQLAPDPIGFDAQGREIVSYLEGDAGHYPLPGWAWHDRLLTEIATLLRRYHDSTVGFTAPSATVWQLAPRQPAEVICHNDFAPYNIVFRDRRPAGVIDFDTASPGPRLWDVAYAAYRFVPLTAPDNPDTPISDTQTQRRRLTLFCAAYGGIETPRPVLHMAVQRLDALIDFITSRAAAGDPAQRRVLRRGDVDIYRSDRAHIHDKLI
ncbi:MAG: phosphotransferase [Pseudomonadota bacterium]